MWYLGVKCHVTHGLIDFICCIMSVSFILCSTKEKKIVVTKGFIVCLILFCNHHNIETCAIDSTGVYAPI